MVGVEFKEEWVSDADPEFAQVSEGFAEAARGLSIEGYRAVVVGESLDVGDQ